MRLLIIYLYFVYCILFITSVRPFETIFVYTLTVFQGHNIIIVISTLLTTLNTTTATDEFIQQLVDRSSVIELKCNTDRLDY